MTTRSPPEQTRTPLRLIHHNANCHRPLFALPRYCYNCRLRYFEVGFPPICSPPSISVSMPLCGRAQRQKNHFSSRQFRLLHNKVQQLMSADKDLVHQMCHKHETHQSIGLYIAQNTRYDRCVKYTTYIQLCPELHTPCSCF